MSYVEMARSHVKELARQAFALTQVVEDEDGDLPFPYGTAVVYLSVEQDGQLLRAWSRAVDGLEIRKPVLRELDEVNRHRVLARAYSGGTSVWVAGCLPVETLRPSDLAGLLHEVGSTADALGSMLATVHGGRVQCPHGAAQHPEAS